MCSSAITSMRRIIQIFHVKSENECESEEKQSGVNRSRFSLSLCFVTSKVEKSNFYRDLESVIKFEIFNKSDQTA